ncbi:hypothetical protein [Desulforhabdus amnigena]|jgi:hypothetical protein|uniref:Uncharacterized protein n=1 Tax=Desulforhabdus amnigena TaxID=40218 RepID=A0A9W6CYP2_9BACT|nr:hypothetical protein [Desulforhabdus amnigena]NLJ29617.1 hypothetical protein [Deltaproteobacteria bacterium]GLI32662.1 hypothetical protein DAMNIGENAA_00950 [Desulforhabdus amnigena]
MELIESTSFLEESKDDMFYVGFMKTGEIWFPLCFVSNPQQNEKFDTLFVSRTYPLMAETVEDYAKKVPQMEKTFVQYLMTEEIRNLLDRYGLRNIMILEPESDSDGCGCGCGCK